MSSSTLMSNHLETDSAELKSYISKFFADKANEFTAQMKTHMDSLVEKKKHENKNIDLDDYFQIPVATVVATKVGETILGECVDF